MNDEIEITSARVYWDKVHANNSKEDIPSDDWLEKRLYRVWGRKEKTERLETV